ncbi:LysR family transcriptional regulator [Megasphaera paucivorans]|uniref:DNA-binding transcriptional regulator, LysR family n=1 Tax=Megasphaera paucivorans TaxID=349095 RepID=A0A1G9XD22_9FIRM|nr:LysR family transcriptional regulator [Megasphaera paucivorans]SDM94431.1 DNA-binding transcriptional regulator, LysR family [Megasphaera paucivorans]
MDLFQLTYFVEVAHKKSFTKASKSLHISQPSISKGIRTLEKNWNTTLFNRKGKTIELTETGLYLLPKVEIIVNDFTKINEQMESSRCLNSGNLSIGIPSMLSMPSIAPFISYFLKTYPYINLELLEISSQKTITAIDEGKIQAGFIILPMRYDIPYEYYIFKEELLNILVWRNHPLTLKQSLTIEDIKNETFVYYPATFALNPFIQSYFQKVMGHPKVVCRSSNWNFLVEMVRIHLGIALVPQNICTHYSNNDIVSIPLIEPKITWTVAMTWKSQGFLPYPAKIWVESFKKYFKNKT